MRRREQGSRDEVRAGEGQVQGGAGGPWAGAPGERAEPRRGRGSMELGRQGAGKPGWEHERMDKILHTSHRE